MIYTRTNTAVFWLLPSLAVGIDIDGKPFMECAWLCFAIGIGALNE